MNMTIPSTLPGGSGLAAAAQPVTGASAVSAGQATTVAATAPNETSAAAASPRPSTEQVQKAIENLKRAAAPMAQNLLFSVDNETNTTVIKVVDGDTKEVIRQIPSEEVLALAKDLTKLQGLLLTRQA